MWLFLTIILAMCILSMSLRFSLFEKNGNSVVAVTGAVTAVAVFYPLAVRLNIQDVSLFMNDYGTLVNVCVVIIVEAISLLLLVPQLITAHFDSRSVIWNKAIVLFPSLSGMIGLFIGLVYLMNCISGWQLGLLAFVSLAAVLVALISIQMLLRYIARWQTRLDLVLTLSFIQIIIAMFLPLVIKGANIAAPDNHNSGRDLFIGVLSFLSIGFTSYLVRICLNKYIGVTK